MEIYDVLIEKNIKENLKVVANDENEVLDFLEDYLEDEEELNPKLERNIDLTISRINKIESRIVRKKEYEMKEFCKKYLNL